MSRWKVVDVMTADVASVGDDASFRVFGSALSKVEVSVVGGVVTLTGELDRRSLVPITVHLAERVDGVVEVISHLTYRYDDGPRRGEHSVAGSGCMVGLIPGRAPRLREGSGSASVASTPVHPHETPDEYI